MNTELDQLSTERLREIYSMTFGIYPAKSDTHYNNRNHYLIILERELKFGRKLNYDTFEYR